MALHTWLIYLLAVIGLSVTPGPNSLLVLTHGALHGHAKAAFTVAGGAVGFIALIALSMLGIGAILQTAAGALTLLKVVGGAYLVWLGIQLWRAPAMRLETDPAVADVVVKRGTLFRQGLLAAVSNPKVLLFYGAFLPQFIDPKRDLLLQFAVMALTFAVVEAFVEILIARLAHRVRPWLQRVGKTFNRGCGTLFAAMGGALPFTR